MEMNIFLPQDLDARAELLNLSTTKHNIMTSQSTKNVICITQDALLGSFLLTRDDVDLGQATFFDICMKGDGWSATYITERLKHIEKVRDHYGYTFPLYCGKSLFSLMLPDTLNYIKKNDARKDQPVVKIIKGVMVEGALSKANLGQAHNSLIHVLHKEYGMDISIGLINNTQFIANQYLLHRCFSIGIKDCVSEIAQETENIAYKCFIEAKDTEASISHERIRELKICAILDKARDLSMKLSKSKLAPENAFIATVTAGSKGEYFNITQITSMLGQQMHMNKRIQKTLNRGRRTLPHYPSTDLTVEQEFESRGFIKNSFLHGLNPQEFIWHAMSGREGCSDTAMKSIIFSTPIVIIENGEAKYTQIGVWVDNLLAKRTGDIKHYTDRQMEMLDCDNVYIPTTDEHGVVTWGAVTFITRHDPGQQLYEIVTKGGRRVTVTESKSLLIWNKDRQCFEDILTPEIVVGDFVPVTATLGEPPIVKEYVNMSSESAFQFSHENGILIGLFLAMGNVSEDNSISITTQNETIQAFVMSWFGKRSVKCEKSEGNVRGYCEVLAPFFKEWVLADTEKFVPSDAFIASIPFITGLVNGYFSGDQCDVTDHSILSGSASTRLTEGINMLCSRLGIFGSVLLSDSGYRLHISEQYAKKFSEQIFLLEESKNMKTVAYTSNTFKSVHDVVLDEIVEINLVDVKNHPKVYDLTIPSTLNFGLANGLQVRDTANSGYIQRKMVKVMEDVQVKYDGTVRNTNGWVVEWAYGNDGFNRSECSFNADGDVFFADATRIADRMNNEYELKNDIV